MLCALSSTPADIVRSSAAASALAGGASQTAACTCGQMTRWQYSSTDGAASKHQCNSTHDANHALRKPQFVSNAPVVAH
jgi:hypothetical protein